MDWFPNSKIMRQHISILLDINSNNTNKSTQEVKKNAI